MNPMSTKADKLSDQVITKKKKLPPIWKELNLNLRLLEKMVSSKKKDAGSIKPLQTNEILIINSATTTSVGTISSTKNNSTTIQLHLPICTKSNNRITLSRRVGSK